MSKLRSEIERLFSQADRLVKNNDRQAAKECYEKILALEGLEETESLAAECAHWGLAEILISLREMDQAEDHLRQAIRINPEEPGYHTELGSLYNYRADFDRAISEFEESLRLRPDHPPTVHLLGWALFMSGDRSRGREVLERALALDDCDTGILNDLAVCLLESGRLDRALKLVERACAVDPGSRLLASFRELIQQRIEEKGVRRKSGGRGWREED